MAEFDRAIDSPEDIRELRKSILQLAVKGKLVPQDPKEEAAEVLLQRIQEEKAKLIAEGKIKKQKPLAEVGEEEMPYVLPEGWVWCRLGEVGLLERGKSKHRPRNDVKLFNGGTFPLVQTGDVSKAKFHEGKIISYTSKYNSFGLAQSRMWNKGTLCITIAANIAETGFLSFDACFPDSVVGFTSYSGLGTSKYVQIFLDVSKSSLEKFAPSTAQKNINLGILFSLIFPFPPLSEQKRIVTKVNQLMALCDRLESKLAQRQQVADQLSERVMTMV